LTNARIGFGGGCHWCTEAVFQSLRGVSKVEQGFIKSLAPHDSYSEAVVVTFDPSIISVDVMIDVHLRTHASTSQHKMRGKYRSAVYVFSDAQADTVQHQIKALQSDFEEPIVTMTLPYDDFNPSLERYQNYYRTNTEKPFCTAYIDPKLSKIRRQFCRYYDPVEPL
jgi:peptide-methionine (S)-S-oxide reductase